MLLLALQILWKEKKRAEKRDEKNVNEIVSLSSGNGWWDRVERAG